MKSALRTVIERLRREALVAPRRVFEAGRMRQAALEAHPDVASVLLALDDDAESTYPAREAITRALIGEHRASSAALWASMLLVAFSPMLVRLRNRLVSDTVPGDELDQLVVTSFLAALTELPLSERTDRVAMRLRQRTERQVFAFLRKERDHRHPSLDVEAVAEADPEALAPRRASTDEKLYDLVLLLQRAVEEGISPSGLDVVEATVLRRELLRSYVERLGPDDDLERERMYQRLKRQRSRALRRLKTLFGASSPLLLASGF
ncbi:hypothetical protein NVS55_08340 [Myxococcus stipitatus]|uniref:hypothetical protein n=1 Tax=Myxococcus stipitatus TaxID=83455 RepID=UPI00314556A4